MANRETKETAAENSCANCKFEKTCGYSPLAMSMSKPKQRTEQSFRPCPLGLMSAWGNKERRPFFLPKGFQFSPDEEIRLEAAHRAGRPTSEWNDIVRIPSGEFDRVNRREYRRAAAETPNKIVRLASMAWIHVGDLQVIRMRVEAQP